MGRAWAERQATLNLGRGASSFMGFGGDVPARLAAGLDARLGLPAPPMQVFDDLFCLPNLRALYSGDGVRLDLTAPTWLDPDLVPTAAEAREIRALDAQSPPTTVLPKRWADVGETVLFLGSLRPHYGLFLTDCLARAWALQHVDPTLRVVFAPAHGLAPQPAFIGHILNALGVSADRVIASAEPLRLRRVICPLPLLQFRRRIYEGFDTPHTAVSAALRPERFHEMAGRTVYLSRSRLPGVVRRTRTIRGEIELEERLAREGFAIVHPETLALAQQVSIFETASAVVGPIGSAMHTLAFRRPAAPPRLAHLSWNAVGGRYPLLDALKGAESHYLRCLNLDIGMRELAVRAIKGHPPSPNDTNLRLDVRRAMDLLDAAGFLSARRRPATPGASPLPSAGSGSS